MGALEGFWDVRLVGDTVSRERAGKRNAEDTAAEGFAPTDPGIPDASPLRGAGSACLERGARRRRSVLLVNEELTSGPTAPQIHRFPNSARHPRGGQSGDPDWTVLC